MPKDYDERISTLLTQVEEQRAAAETAINAFFDVAAGELGPYLRQWVKEEGTRQHTVLTTLAVERVTALKTELDGIVAALPQHVRKWIDLDQFWAHRPKWRSQSTNTFYGYQIAPGARRGPHSGDAGKVDEHLAKGTRELMSGFLERYGFRFTTHGAHKFVMNSMDWTDAMNASMKRYAVSYDAFKAAQEELAKAKEEKGRHDAEELWNKA